MKHLQWLSVALVAVVLSACASTPVRSRPENGAIYGYYDIPKDDFGNLSAMAFMQYPFQFKTYFGEATDLKYVIADGAFFAFDAAPGQYFLESFMASKPFGGTMYFRLVFVTADSEYTNEQARQHLITVKPGQLVYLGAQQVSIKDHAGWFHTGKLSIGPVESPSEREVLVKLLPALQGTAWEQSIKERIAALQ